jgi:hypothetical protein
MEVGGSAVGVEVALHGPTQPVMPEKEVLVHDPRGVMDLGCVQDCLVLEHLGGNVLVLEVTPAL